MESIKQTDTWSCVACCLAMVTEKDLEYVIKHIGHDGSGYDENSSHPDKRRGFNLKDTVKYLIDHDVIMGAFLSPIGGVMAAGPNAFAYSSHNPALLTVKSERLPSPAMHVVYWNGEYVLDPNPSVKGVRNADEYFITEIWPLLWLKDEEEKKC